MEQETEGEMRFLVKIVNNASPPGLGVAPGGDYSPQNYLPNFCWPRAKQVLLLELQESPRLPAASTFSPRVCPGGWIKDS